MPSQMKLYESLMALNARGDLATDEMFRRVFASVDTRVSAAEAVSVDAAKAIEDLRNRGLAIIAETLAPSVNDAQTLVTEASGYLAGLQAEGLPAGLVQVGGPIEGLPGVADAQTAIVAIAAWLTTLSLPPERITGLVEALAGKAAGNHTHAMDGVQGLPAALASKAAVGHLHGLTYDSDTTPYQRPNANSTFAAVSKVYSHAPAADAACWVEIGFTAKLTGADGGGGGVGVIQMQALVGSTWTDVGRPCTISFLNVESNGGTGSPALYFNDRCGAKLSTSQKAAAVPPAAALFQVRLMGALNSGELLDVIGSDASLEDRA